MPDETFEYVHHTVAMFTLGPYETNCYVVAPRDGSKSCWIIDASFEPAAMIEHVREQGLSPTALMFTHAHIDHIAGAHEIARAFAGLAIEIHTDEEKWLLDPERNLSALAGRPVTAPAATALLKDGDERNITKSAPWRVLHVPGHSPGSVAFYCPADNVAISGDAIFLGSVGRTDFPGCSPQSLAHSIKTKLYTLPDATTLLPGHGPATEVGYERRTNPFVRG
jgi:hydroxyacylglutathione hydrolase